MIIALFGLLQRDIVLFLVTLVSLVGAILVAISVHEASHAWAAYRMGDDTARRLGRLSLNPLRHLDPLGTLMLLVAGFGWGKPVPVDAYRLRRGVKAGMALVSLAGPLSNFAVAGALGLLVRFGVLSWHTPISYSVPFGQRTLMWMASDVIGYVITFNIILGVFNLLPIAPLDGFKVALGLLPRSLAHSAARLEQYGSMALLTMVAFDVFFRTGILWSILSPGLGLATRVLVGKPFL
ncbi:MAG TPA: site-2 protease family protein [Dehalococcoidia bacterium]|nr:site-2 protease family protein [Dehalococcoidia bacterium]